MSNTTTPKKSAHKAIWATIIAFVVSLAKALQVSVSNGASLTDRTTWLNAILAGIIGGGATGGVTFAVPNKQLS
jgi:hypothetical protein